MPLALGPQCCCDVPGFFRWGMNYAFVDVDRVDTGPCYAEWVQWMVSCWDTLHEYLGCSFAYTPAMGNATGYDLLGYDSYHDRVYLANAPGSPWNWFYFNYPSEGGVSYFKLSDVSNCLATLVEAISDEDGQAILDGSDPTSGSPEYIEHFWSDYSNGRLYGFTTWDSGTDHSLKAWSVQTDGTDYSEHFTVTNSGANSPPYSSSVCDGHIYTVEDHGGDYRFRVDGSVVADMTKDTILEGIDLYGTNVTALAAVDSQVLGLSVVKLSSVNFIYTTIVLVADGETDVYQRLQFVADEDGDDVEYYPVRLGWDERMNSVVIMWADSIGGFGTQPIGKYVTYHTRALEPGNILTQMDHVKVYACLPFGGDFYGNCSYGFGVVIPGKMPPPLTVTGRVITPPVPPPPPPDPSCDALAECTDVTATGGLRVSSAIDTVVDGAGTDDYGGTFTGRTIYYGNFSRDYDMAMVTGAPGGPCSGGAPSTTYAFHVNVSDDTYDDYDHPGILLAEWEYSDPTQHAELYVTDILFGVNCIDPETYGALQIKHVMIAVQKWSGSEGSTWPPTGGSAWSCYLALDGDIQLVTAHSGFADPTGCAASFIESLFSFGDWFINATGDKLVSALLQIGTPP